MNFGLLESFRNSDRNEFSYSELYRRHVDLAVEAEEMGYDTIWLTEHHFVEDGYSPAMLPLAGAIAARTKKIRIGTFVLLLPLHHPLHVAESAATVDVLSGRRFDLGLGQGYRPQEFDGFNIPRSERASRLREGVEDNPARLHREQRQPRGQALHAPQRDALPQARPKAAYSDLDRCAQPQGNRARRAQRLPPGRHRPATGRDT